MAKPGFTKLTSAMSHPQALGQCRHYLREHGIIPVAYADTAAAAAFVAVPSIALPATPGFLDALVGDMALKPSSVADLRDNY